MERLRQKHRAAARDAGKVGQVFGLPTQSTRLTNGRYSVQLTAAGGGVSEWEGLAVSRWMPDPTCDADGFFIYLRDLEDGSFWSAGYQPTRVLPDVYEFQFSSSGAEIVRTDREIECRLTVGVAPDQDCELRRCRLTNGGQRPRKIEITSYVEFVLATREADANHPTFSKLFVETEFCRDANAIFARRRPRSSVDLERWGFHRLLADLDSIGHDLQFETNRKAFIGRGRSLSHPRALDRGAKLAGDQGPVLDPIGSLRTTVWLAPGETREVVFVLGASASRRELENQMAAFHDLPAAQIFFNAPATTSALNGNAQRWIAHPSHDPPTMRLHEGVSNGRCQPEAAVETEVEVPQLSREALQFENSYGGFSADGREYVIRIEPDADGRLGLPPQPWVNVIANEQAGCLVTERGAGYTWAGNSRHNRLSAWNNDPVCDPHAEALWIRDEETGGFWSPMPGPTPAPARYEVRHGFGYTRFHHTSFGLAQEVTIFMAPDDPVKLVRVQIENRSSLSRRLSVFSYLQWGLRCTPVDLDPIDTTYDHNLAAILACNFARDVYSDSVAFSAVVADSATTTDITHTSARESFLGRFGEIASPAAVAEPRQLDNRTGSGLDACAAWRIPFRVAAGETIEFTILLGETTDHDAAAKLIGKFRRPGQVQHALEQVNAFWRKTLSAIEVETPDRQIDLMVNGWLPYQNLACRMWARSAYYQPGGAFGFRDQLQDSAALVYHQPDLTRRQIVRHAGQQFVEGDVMHWWHADNGLGLRTRFSDDLAWLPYVTATYVGVTGDEALLDKTVPFIRGERLADDQHEVCMRSEPSGVSATIYEHCCLALDRALTVGPHGLPLIGSGDWNDGMNRVGKMGQGESVWLGFFLYTVLGQMFPICERRGDLKRTQEYASHRARLAAGLNEAGWDGAWYRRAFYDNGQPLGSAESDECQIDAIAQAWSVLSGAAPRERAEMAMRAAQERLVDDRAGLIRLLAPPFDRTPNDPGYIKGYVPGVRENGGQYTHGVLWLVGALARMGHGTRAVEHLRMLSPVTRTSTAEQVAIYQTEPYVVAADVYSEPPHVGRGGWTWYTGSAGWMFRVAVESILGFSIEGGETIVLKPAISADWPQCRLRYRLPDGQTRYEIRIENPAGKETGVTSATVDGRLATVVDGAARIPIEHDGKAHSIIVYL
ncbi:MAG: hypothetical protein WD851_15635 [Pirellulales bacterium]